MASPSASESRPSATTWSPGFRRTRSPVTSSLTAASRDRPSRTTVAVGATSAASRSSACFARTSCAIPIVMFAISTPRNSASRQSANASVKAPNTIRIRLKIVSVFARTMLAYERLLAGGATSPRSASRRLASASLNPDRAGVDAGGVTCPGSTRCGLPDESGDGPISRSYGAVRRPNPRGGQP